MEHAITTVILAGGRGVRIGGNKGLQRLGDKPLIAWVIEAVRRDSHALLINANGDDAAYFQFGYPVIKDVLPDWQGPLAGLHAALLRAETGLVMSVPCDTPFLPDDLIARCRAKLGDAEAVVVVAEGVRQPAIALYRKSVLPKLEAYMQQGGRKVNGWLDTLRITEEVFQDDWKFNNINTLQELRAAESRIAG